MVNPPETPYTIPHIPYPPSHLAYAGRRRAAKQATFHIGQMFLDTFRTVCNSDVHSDGPPGVGTSAQIGVT